jgi:dTDP-4-dehydrorhamnose reductase
MDLSTKRILVTGVTGQVGGALKAALQGRCELITAARSGADIDFDLSDHAKIKKIIAEIKPDVIINPAAYTQVDQAEDEPELAMSINGIAPGVIAEGCKKHQTKLIHFSTDYVFDGSANKPYTETDKTAPINVYGKTKLAGEQAIQSVGCDHLIFRTCWVYDAFGKNFVNAILNRARTMETLKVVNDQQGTPTWAGFIASTIKDILEQPQFEGVVSEHSNRIYNLRPNGVCSWYDFAREIVDFAAVKEHLVVKKILPVSSSEFPTKAYRPSWSVLDNDKIKEHFNLSVASWQKYMDQCLT